MTLVIDTNVMNGMFVTNHPHYIITNDKHFAPLIGSGYKPQPITPEEFFVRFLVPKP